MKVGLGHKGIIADFPDGGGTQCMRLRNCAYVRAFSPSIIPPGNWNQIFVGLRMMSDAQLYWEGDPGGLFGTYWLEETPMMSMGLCAGNSGAIAYTDVAGTSSHFIGMAASLSGNSQLDFGRTPSPYTDNEYIAITFAAKVFKSGTITEAGAGGQLNIGVKYPSCQLYYFERTGGNLLLYMMQSPVDRNVPQSELLDIMNYSMDWVTLHGYATGTHGWTSSTTSRVSTVDDQSTYGNLTHFEIGWWQNEISLYLDLINITTS